MSRALSILAAAEEHPRRDAVVTAERVYTFADAARAVGSVIAFLERQRPELQTGDRLPILGTPCVEGLWTVYAALELGICLVPVHSRWTDGERASFLERLGLGRELDPAFDFIPETGLAPDLSKCPAPDPEALAAVLATSGSTGRPKGVALSRRAFLASAAADAHNVGRRADDRSLLSLPLAHVGGLSIVIRSLVGRTAVVVPEPAPRFEAEDFLRTVERFRVTRLSLVPTMLRRLVALDEAPPPSVRVLLLGGAAAPESLVRRARELGWPVLPTYGLTEACSQVATERPDADGRGKGIGPLVHGVEGRVVDGVLELGGPTLMSGYLPSDGPGAGLTPDGRLRTGDLARIDEDGRLHVLGRADDVIVTGGENVSPLEVETALEEHPAVTGAAVFGVDDPEWGEAVHARVLLAEGTAVPSEGELRDFLRKSLARFKIPRRIEIVDSLPLTPSGKVDRRRLRSAAPTRDVGV